MKVIENLPKKYVQSCQHGSWVSARINIGLHAFYPLLPTEPYDPGEQADPLQVEDPAAGKREGTDQEPHYVVTLTQSSDHLNPTQFRSYCFRPIRPLFK